MNRIALALSLWLAIGAAGCSQQDNRPLPERVERRATSASANSPRPVDTDLVAFLSKARAAHHAADLAESKGDLALATKHVDKIVNGPQPAATPELIEVLADAHARLADLKSRQGLFDDALREVDRGLALAKDITHFRGHLFEVRGLVQERLMRALKEKGDDAGAEKARVAAVEAFETAIEIQDEVIMKALPDPPVPAPSGGAAPSSLPAPSSSGI